MKYLASLLLIIGLFAFAVPPSAQIKVVDKLGNLVEGATITFYHTKEDYRAEKNPVATGLTDKKGKATFKKLEPKSYFLHVYKGEMNNNFAGVQTDTLQTGKVNKLIIVIE